MMNVFKLKRASNIKNLNSYLNSREASFRRWLINFVINNKSLFNINQIVTSNLLPFEVYEIVKSLKEKKVIIIDEQGNIPYVFPVSAIKTNHKVSLQDGRNFYALCAIDALGVAFTFDKEVVVDSVCYECGRPIHLKINNEFIVDMHPSSICVLYVDLNKYLTWIDGC